MDENTAEKREPQKEESVVASLNLDGGDSLYEITPSATRDQKNMVTRAACEFVPEPTSRERQREIAEEARRERVHTAAYKTGRGIRRATAKTLLWVLDVIELVCKAIQTARENKDTLAGMLERICIALLTYFFTTQDYAWVVGVAVAGILLYILKFRFGEGPVIQVLRMKIEKIKTPKVASTKKLIEGTWFTQHFKPDEEEGEEAGDG